jgi:TIR domain
MATLFFSYSHQDEVLRNELEVHLSMLKRQGILEPWHDRRIVAGEEFNKTIDKKLEEADIILLLVSPDFLASDYCYNIEMQRALERHERNEACVIPVILRPCDWHHAPFGKLLAMPTDGKPISKFSSQDDAFLEVVTAIRRVVSERELRQNTTPPAQSYVLSTDLPALDAPRSSNLRIRKTFSDHDRDTFLGASFEYIANFFENSLTELSNRNPEVSKLFKRIDADRFTAVVYVFGKAVTECRISLGGNVFSGVNKSIFYSSNASGNDNSYNESISIVDDGYALFWQPLGMPILGSRRQDEKTFLTQQGAAEYFWDMLIERLQQR